MIFDWSYMNELLLGIGQCVHDISLSQGLFISLFLAGLFGGLTHCSVMCGPFVMSQAGQVEKLRDAMLRISRGAPYNVYYAGSAHSAIMGVAFLFLPIRSFIVAPVISCGLDLFGHSVSATYAPLSLGSAYWFLPPFENLF